MRRDRDSSALHLRAARHAALGDRHRLAIVDELARSDRSPAELGGRLDLESNLLAHHLAVLERVGLVERRRSSGDGRRRYVHLVRAALDELTPTTRHRPTAALFVCTRNSARSQLAAAMWRRVTGEPGESAGTRPAGAVDPRAVAAGHRAGIDLAGNVPRAIDEVGSMPPLVVTVCDQAHEELGAATASWLHWSLADPVVSDDPAAFDRTIAELAVWFDGLVEPERAPIGPER
jgi:protein-tyrosine-phosphatase/DNA-binding HxlR family transcriptional regulator